MKNRLLLLVVMTSVSLIAGCGRSKLDKYDEHVQQIAQQTDEVAAQAAQISAANFNAAQAAAVQATIEAEDRRAEDAKNQPAQKLGVATIVEAPKSTEPVLPPAALVTMPAAKATQKHG